MPTFDDAMQEIDRLQMNKPPSKNPDSVEMGAGLASKSDDEGGNPSELSRCRAQTKLENSVRQLTEHMQPRCTYVDLEFILEGCFLVLFSLLWHATFVVLVHHATFYQILI